jgi:hypothetical protein
MFIGSRGKYGSFSCYVWYAHYEHNRDQCKDPLLKSCLSLLITEEDVCKMRVAKGSPPIYCTDGLQSLKEACEGLSERRNSVVSTYEQKYICHGYVGAMDEVVAMIERMQKENGSSSGLHKGEEK